MLSIVNINENYTELKNNGMAMCYRNYWIHLWLKAGITYYISSPSRSLNCSLGMQYHISHYRAMPYIISLGLICFRIIKGEMSYTSLF